MTTQPPATAAPTPGPWRVELMKRTTGWLIHGPQGESITDGPIWTESFAKESRANAHLIAAAPDLLVALEAFTEAMDMHLGHAHEVAICNADDQARAAIAKARKP